MNFFYTFLYIFKIGSLMLMNSEFSGIQSKIKIFHQYILW